MVSIKLVINEITVAVLNVQYNQMFQRLYLDCKTVININLSLITNTSVAININLFGLIIV